MKKIFADKRILFLILKLYAIYDVQKWIILCTFTNIQISNVLTINDSFYYLQNCFYKCKCQKLFYDKRQIK